MDEKVQSNQTEYPQGILRCICGIIPEREGEPLYYGKVR